MSPGCSQSEISNQHGYLLCDRSSLSVSSCMASCTKELNCLAGSYVKKILSLLWFWTCHLLISFLTLPVLALTKLLLPLEASNVPLLASGWDRISAPDLCLVIKVCKVFACSPRGRRSISLVLLYLQLSESMRAGTAVAFARGSQEDE